MFSQEGPKAAIGDVELPNEAAETDHAKDTNPGLQFDFWAGSPFVVGDPFRRV